MSLQPTPGCALAIAAYPDVIQFMMAGTLLHLVDRGWTIHYLVLADGRCGSVSSDPRKSAAMRLEETQSVCAAAGFKHHPAITRDFGVEHNPEQIAKVISIIRETKPDFICAPAPEDCREDRQNAAKIAATAALSRNIANADCTPLKPPMDKDCIVYHALPYGLRDTMRHRVIPEFTVDITGVMDRKSELLALHRSHRDWLNPNLNQTIEESTTNGLRIILHHFILLRLMTCWKA